MADDFNTLNEEFTNLENPAETAEGGKKQSKAKSAHQELINRVVNQYGDEVRSDEEFVAAMRSASNTLRILNTLGYGESGSLVPGKKDGERTLEPTSKIVGYRVQNTGTVPIPFECEVYDDSRVDENGNFIPDMQANAIAPGQTLDIPSHVLSMIGIRTEFSLTFANGKMQGGTKVIDAENPLDALHFVFTPENGQPALQKHNDKVKLAIASNNGVRKVGDKEKKYWKVKKEFRPFFAYLENEEVKTGGRKATTPKVDVITGSMVKYLQDMQAKGIRASRVTSK